MPDVRRPQGHFDAQAAHQSTAGGPASRQPIPACHQPTEEKGQEGAEEETTSAPAQERRQEYGADERSYCQQCHGHHHRVQTEKQVYGDDIQHEFIRSWIAFGEQHGCAVKSAPVSVTRRTMTPCDVDNTILFIQGESDRRGSNITLLYCLNTIIEKQKKISGKFNFLTHF